MADHHDITALLVELEGGNRPSRSLYVHNTPDFALSDGDGAREALAPPSEDAPS